jgi:ubiquinone/menaquinone biosynthesis C-methylase UbiE
MRVMDVGCGVGDTTFLAADLVGPNGFVVGIDRSPDAIATARQRAETVGRPNVQFVVADLGSPIAEQELFDAVVGRYVLVHQQDIVAALRSLRDLVRPGGLIAFHEIELGTTQVADPSSELVERVRFWLREAFRVGGVQLDAVSQMPRYFYEAGLGWPETSIYTTVSSGPDGFGPDWIVSTLRSLASLLEQAGVAARNELGLETLAARLRESCANGAASVVTVNGGVWARRT